MKIDNIRVHAIYFYSFTDEEAEALNAKLNKDIRHLQGEKYYSDPPIFGQKLALVSFVPSSGAKPDESMRASS